MVKTLLYILGAILAISLVKMFVGIIVRGLGIALQNAAGGAPQGAPGRRETAPGTSKGGTLRKDSLTGIYVAEEIAVAKVINGRTHYFASEQNYREYVQRVAANT